MGMAEDVGDQLVGAFQDPGILLGIPLALAGAVFMSLGAQYQHRGVEKVERLSGSTGTSGLTFAQIKGLLTRPSWIVGTLMLALAIVCQLAALVRAPLIVVQPLGAIALVITTLLNARITGHSPTRQSLTAIICCVGGIFLFVFFAAIYATEQEVTDRELFVILALLLVVIIVLGACWLILRHRMRALFYVIGAGILYGFVATLAKVVIKRIEAGQFEWITGICVLALVSAAAVGAYFVQTAYSSGPPDLVIAGLTVVDPLIAVLIGMVVLGEAAAAPWWVLVIFGIAGAIAVWGVVGLARYHPQVLSDSQELGIERGSTPTSSGSNSGPNSGPNSGHDARAAGEASPSTTATGAPGDGTGSDGQETPPWRQGSSDQP
ncbi:DMT family transporter [Microbacterium oxydans]|jgi:drug/metabolite transporter (DMT)-like permease|uniref:DMT family transporter n=1 Tax=Microbacterium oxydans TaxID=82380 RepID=UPI002B4A4846|nr:DMT family transporter [Microbacterium oxydans]